MGLLKPRSVSKLVFHGDDMEHLGELRLAVARAESALEAAEDRAERVNRGPRRGGDEIANVDDEREALAAAQTAYDAATDEAAERAVEVTLTAIGSRRFRDLLAEHPAREDDETDAEYGVNVETFPRALLLYADPDVPSVRTIAKPAVADTDLVEFVDDECSEGDFEELWVTAYWLNKAQGVDPRLGKYSPATPTSSVS